MEPRKARGCAVVGGNSKEAYSSGLDALARALASWAASRNGARAGPRVRFPRFKRKGRGGQGCRFTTGAIRVEADRHHVVLPRLGRIKTHESTRKLARRLEQGTARVLAATICHSGGRWFCSFTCEVQRAQRTPRQPASVVGVDVGIRHLAVVSTGQVVDNPAPLKANLRKLRRQARQLARQQGPRTPGGARRVPSASWLQTKARLAKTHAWIANLRRNALHRLTSDLARTDGTVVVERLHVAGMVQNRRLARAIADSGMGQVRRLLGYKCPWNGGRLVEADLSFPSSKTCSGCGTVKAKLSLAERTFECAACGLRQDRDLNAARNLAALVEAVEVVDDGNRMVVVAGSGPETETPVEGTQDLASPGGSPQKREASGPSKRWA
jgi:transposase